MELMTNSEAYNFIVSIISRLSTDGFNINIGNFNNITFQDLDKDIGHFWLADTKIYNISFNKKLLAKNKLNFLKKKENLSKHSVLKNAVNMTLKC